MDNTSKVEEMEDSRFVDLIDFRTLSVHFAVEGLSLDGIVNKVCAKIQN